MRFLSLLFQADIEPELEQRSSSRLAQTGTQTSPDSVGEEIVAAAQVFIGPSCSKVFICNTLSVSQSNYTYLMKLTITSNV